MNERKAGRPVTGTALSNTERQRLHRQRAKQRDNELGDELAQLANMLSLLTMEAIATVQTRLFELAEDLKQIKK